MPTPRVTDDVLLETLETLRKHDFNKTFAAKELGLNESAVRRRFTEAKVRGLHLSGGAQQAMAGAKLSGQEVDGGWRHIYNSDGDKIETVRWSAPKLELHIGELMERATVAFSTLPKAPAIPSPKHTAADLLTLYPLFDVHLGMHAWGDETGGDNYDLKLSVSDMHMAVGNVMALSPDSAEAILLIGGDFFHGDDNTNQTPRNHHPLDVDGRHFKVLDTGIEVVAGTIERLASKHKRVTVRVLRGNHDEHSHMVLTLALAQRYRGHERITVDKSPRDIFMHQWGKCLIAAHHGDKAKPERLAMILAEICPFWSTSPYRIVFTGHKHNQKSEDFPGIAWEQFRAFCPPDAYGAQFAPRRALHALTFHRDHGLSMRAQDPIKRRSDAVPLRVA
jgi:hypothetical protein